MVLLNRPHALPAWAKPPIIFPCRCVEPGYTDAHALRMLISPVPTGRTTLLHSVTSSIGPTSNAPGVRSSTRGGCPCLRSNIRDATSNSVSGVKPSQISSGRLFSGAVVLISVASWVLLVTVSTPLVGVCSGVPHVASGCSQQSRNVGTPRGRYSNRRSVVLAIVRLVLALSQLVRAPVSVVRAWSLHQPFAWRLH